jgi:hypothetical protein
MPESPVCYGPPPEGRCEITGAAGFRALGAATFTPSTASAAQTFGLPVPDRHAQVGRGRDRGDRDAHADGRGAPAGFGADPAVLVMLGVALALLGACRTVETLARGGSDTAVVANRAGSCMAAA